MFASKYESDIANIKTTDTDLGKVEVSRHDPTKSGTLKSAAGAEFDEIQNNAKARIPGMIEEYETYERDLETIKITAETLIRSLEETDSVLGRESDRYAASLDGYKKAGDDAKELEWFPLSDLPELAFDHAKIIKDYITSISK